MVGCLRQGGVMVGVSDTGSGGGVMVGVSDTGMVSMRSEKPTYAPPRSQKFPQRCL